MRNYMRLAFAPLAIVLPIAGFAQGKIDQILNAISSVTEYREAAISPDGKRLAYVQALKNKDTTESRNKAIYLLDLTRPAKLAQRMAAGDAKTPADERAPAWSPDSSRLAFLSDRRKSGQLQLYVTGPKGDARKLTSLTGYLADPRWSPDGRQIAILFTENAPRPAGPLEPATKDNGVVEDKFFEQRLALVNVATGQTRSLSPADTYVYEFDWSPDSRNIVYTASKGNGDNNWWIAQLFAIDASNGTVRHLVKPEMQIAIPRWSPDGSTIAFIGGLMSDEGSTGGDVFTVPAAGGTPRDITPGRKASPSWLKWTGAGRLVMTETVDGGTAITQLDTA
ncbi:MAG: S9 family peptidase, partial [Acidobacteriota bacterium]|nr:S9 family peptidase [Acidobacteriota bacterium]